MKRLTAFFLTLALLMSCASFAFAADATDAVTNYPSAAALAEDNGFKMGAVISFMSLYDAEYCKLIKRHFNSITASNEFKAYSMLDQRASMQNVDGMPVMNYRQADAIMDFAKENGIKVRGHVLVWDAYMSDWFFRAGYKNGAAFVDRDTMLKRLEYYITEVVTHFEEKYPGVLYCWDVVNEAVADDVGERLPGDDRHLRVTRGGADNLFYKVIGEDYVEYSFLYARNVVEKLGANITLFYNDYNAFNPTKREAMCRLIESVNSFDGERMLCDGVGMQGYIGGYGQQAGCMNSGDLANIRDAIKRYAEIGVEVQLTEMAVRTYLNDEATMKKHAEFYGNLFKVFKSVNAGENKPLTAVTIWGLLECPSLPSNNYSFKLNSPYGGLFTEQYAVKDCFRTVLEVLGQ